MKHLLVAVAAASLALASAPSFAATGQTSQQAGYPGSLTKVFTSTNTDTVPIWANIIQATYCGGGGGGENVNSGNGGGSGECLVDEWATVSPGATITITIGAGGASAVNGGNTAITGTVQTLPIACGGLAGPNSAGGRKGAGGGVCSVSAGSWPSIPNSVGAVVPIARLFPGQDGGPTNSVETCFQFDGSTLPATNGGNGGCSPYGKGGLGATGAGAGNNASGFSAGGGGPGTASTTGGSGTGGIAFIRYLP